MKYSKINYIPFKNVATKTIKIIYIAYIIFLLENISMMYISIEAFLSLKGKGRCPWKDELIETMTFSRRLHLFYHTVS